MTTQKPPVQTWEMMQAIKRAVGITAMQRIFSVGITQINRYCRNPEYTSDSERDPILRLRKLFDEAVAQDARDDVRAAINFLAESIDSCVADVARPAPDKETLEAEALDDHPPLCAFHVLATARDPMEHPRVLRDARAKLDRELDQTQAAHEIAWTAEQAAADQGKAKTPRIRNVRAVERAAGAGR